MESLPKLKTGLLLVLNSFLILSLKIKIFPEIFIFPWLVVKGLLPYRDFFDHHGPLVYYLLAPLSLDKSLNLIKTAYFILQTGILYLTLKIIRRQTKYYFFGGLLFILVNFFMAENVFWYENFITLFFLIIYDLSLKKMFPYKNVILAVLIWAVSLVKPHAGLILIPVFLLVKEWRLVMYFVFLWLSTLGFFYFEHALPFFIDNLFRFNIFCGQYFSQRPIILFDIEFLRFSLLILLLNLLINIINKKMAENLFLFSFMVVALFFFLPSYSKTHTTVIIPFLVIFLGKTLSLKNNYFKPLLVFISLTYLFSTAGLVVRHYQWLQKQPAEHYDKIEQLYRSDRLPQTRFILDFPWVKQYYKLQ